MHVCLVCSRILPPPIADSDEEDEDAARLTLKELLAEFNEKVKAHGGARPPHGWLPSKEVPPDVTFIYEDSWIILKEQFLKVPAHCEVYHICSVQRVQVNNKAEYGFI